MLLFFNEHNDSIKEGEVSLWLKFLGKCSEGGVCGVGVLVSVSGGLEGFGAVEDGLVYSG